MIEKRWIGPEPARSGLVSGLTAPQLAILERRGLNTEREIEAFMDRHYGQETDPFQLRDMDRAVDRLESARAAEERVVLADIGRIVSSSLDIQEVYERFAEKVKAPLVANMTEFGKSPLLSIDDLDELGYAVALYPVTLLRVAMKAVEITLETIADAGDQTELLDIMQTREELYNLLGYQEFEQRDREFFAASHEKQ